MRGRRKIEGKVEGRTLMLRSAYLRGTFGMTLEAIAEALGGAAAGIYIWDVDRWLREAKKQGLLIERKTLEFRPRGLNDEQLALVRDVRMWQELLKRLRRVAAANHVPVRKVRVFPSGTGATELRLVKFGMQAAGALTELLRRSNTFALAWGTTIAHVIDALDVRGMEPLDRHVEFVPVRAEEPGDPLHGTSSSSLAARLDEIVNATSGADGDNRARQRPLSLNGVPAFTPSAFADDVRFREYLHDFPAFHEIFGLTSRDVRLQTAAPAVRAPIIGRVDGLLTSIGTRDRPVGGFYERLKKHGRITADALSRIVLGDVGGVLIPAPNCSRRDLDRVAALNQIFTGLQREHLEDIATRSHRDGTPGVIVVSMGDQGGARARTLLGVVRAGLVNELIIDRQLADSLLALLDEEERRADVPAVTAQRPVGRGRGGSGADRAGGPGAPSSPKPQAPYSARSG